MDTLPGIVVSGPVPICAAPPPETSAIDESVLKRYAWASKYRWMRELIASDRELEKNPPWHPSAARPKPFTVDEVENTRTILIERYGIDGALLTVGRLAQGMNVELEHGRLLGSVPNITFDEPVMTARIALAHFHEDLFYYDRLARAEAEAEAFWHAHGGTPELWPAREFLRV